MPIWRRLGSGCGTRCGFRSGRTLDPVVGVAGPVFEMYVEGRLVGQSGQLSPEIRDGPLRYWAFPIPGDLVTPGRVVTVALRTWRYPGYELRRLDNLALAPGLTLRNAGETPLYAEPMRASFRGRAWAMALGLFLLLFLFLSGPAQ